MDYVNILKRGLQLVWRNKFLWFLGLLASCAGGSGGVSGNFNLPDFSNTSTRPGGGGGTPDFDPNQILAWLQREGAGYVGVIIAVLCILFLISIVAWIIGVLGRGALVAGSDAADRGAQTGFSPAWGAATARAGRLVGMNLVLFGPVWIIGLLVLAGFAIFFISSLLPAIQSQRSVDFERLLAPFLGVMCVFVALACVSGVYQTAASVLRVFAERAIMLDEAPAVGSIKSGWQVLRNKFVEWFVLALIMWFVNVVVGVVIGVLFVGAFAAMFVGGAGVGVATQGFGGNGGAALGGIALLAAAGLCVVLLVSTIIGSFVNAWSGAVWTLAYRATAHPPAAFPPPAWPQPQPQG